MPSAVTTNSYQLSKTQKTTPAYPLKQLRATAAVLCYDHAFGLPIMPSSEFKAKLMNMYLVSQVDLMCGGKGKYMNMYNMVQSVVTNPDAEFKESDDNPPPQYIGIVSCTSGI